MKRNRAILCFVLLWSAGRVVRAQESQEPQGNGTSQKIGFINIDIIEDQWIDYQVMKNDLDKLFILDRMDIRDLRDDIKQRQRHLEERLAQGRLSEAEYKNLSNRLLLEGQKVAFYAEMRARIVKKKVDKKLDRATQIVGEAIREIAEEEGYDFVLNDVKLLGSDSKIDVSDKVIKRLNATSVHFLTGVHESAMAEMTLGELAEKVGGRVDGDGSTVVRGVSGVLEAGPGDVSFIDNPKYLTHVKTCAAAALIVHDRLDSDFRPLIRAENPYLAFTRAMELLMPDRQKPPLGVHPSAVIAPGVEISSEAAVMANVVISERAKVEGGAVLHPGVVVGDGARIGRNALIYPNVTIHDETFIGEGSIIHSGVTLGVEPRETDAGRSSPAVEIDASVEIGANSTVVAGVGRPTRIGRGTKIDNLVHVDHSVQIGEDTVIVAMVTIEPEAIIGNEVTVAGQVGVGRGVRIGSRSVIAARSVVLEDVPEGQIWSGIPAISHEREKRIKAALMRLPKLYKRVQQIEERMSGSAENG